jgi:hypothetical protein
MAPKAALRHVTVPDAFLETARYRAPPGRGSTKGKTHDPAAHGRRLLDQLEIERARLGEVDARRQALALTDARGLVVEVVSEPTFLLALKSLHSPTHGIELLSVRQRGDQQLAALRVTEKGLTRLKKLLVEYTAPPPDGARPKNAALIDSVAELRRGVLRACWSDEVGLLPTDDAAIWWEVWLRRPDPVVDVVVGFRADAARLGVSVHGKGITFPDRCVCLAFGTLAAMSECVDYLDRIAELRRARLNPEPLLQASGVEQLTWVDELRARVMAPTPDAPRVCMLDTGLDAGHPLLAPAVVPGGLFAYREAWGTHDHDGHGTRLSGLAAYGDLTEAFASSAPVALPLWLESGKILPPGDGANPRDLYGSITIDAIGQVEVASRAERVICLAVTDREVDFHGKPSSWSGAVDELASGALDGFERLICVAAGNGDPAHFLTYPDNVVVAPIQEPGQAWNALTVGAFTARAATSSPEFPGYAPLAPAGDLSPHTSSGASWSAAWPHKPDLVLEGGNLARSPDGDVAWPDDLQLLTTARRDPRFARRLLERASATSAATALAARMGAQIMSEYPDFWPQTVRGLLVHSARWTRAMLQRFDLRSESGRRSLLRTCGHGVPDLAAASWSARDALTLVAQRRIQPFERVGSQGKMRDIHFHPLPWPAAELARLGHVDVELRVTLSYFVEPSPGERGWSHKHRYASHGLRFDVRGAAESQTDFVRRLSEDAADEEDGRTRTPSRPQDSAWMLGTKLRTSGSLHQDTWTGTAVDLASRGMIAVFPVVGWWRERPGQGMVDKGSRYALILSIRVPEAVGVDLYTEVVQVIAARVAVAT